MVDYAPARMVVGQEVHAAVTPETAHILTPRALDFVCKLERAFGERRRELLVARDARQIRIDAGEMPDFLA